MTDSRDAAPSTATPVMWVAALLGLGASAESTRVHYKLLTDPSYASFCDVSATVSCTNAYSSAYGAIAGVPTALLGVLFFAGVLLVLALTSRSAASRAHASGYVLLMSAIGLLFVGYLGYASLVVLKTICLLCVTTYVAVVGLFVSAVTATRVSMSAMPERLAADLRRLFTTPAAMSALVAFVAAAAVLLWSFPSDTVMASAAEPGVAEEQQAVAIPPLQPAQQAELEKFIGAQQRVPVMVASEGAAVVLVKFNDYMCPPCGQTFAEYKPVLAKWAKEYPGKLKFVTKDYPLDPECNQFAPGGSHMASCEAAVAVRLAREKGKAAPMEDWLFANQPSLTPASVKTAVQAIAGVSDFDARYQTTLQLVKGDIAQGGQLQVQGTPTFFLNGIRLPGLRASFLDAAIALEMKRAGVALK
jgi:uncharacterized membrane protein/protein-disulfide isomerase